MNSIPFDKTITYVVKNSIPILKSLKLIDKPIF